MKIRRYWAPALSTVLLIWSGTVLASTACDAVNAGQLNVTSTGFFDFASASVPGVSFEVGDVVTAATTNAVEASFTPPGANPGYLNGPGGSPETTAVMLTMTDTTQDSMFSFVRAPSLGGSATLSLSCTPVGGGGSSSNGDEAAAQRDAVQAAVTIARPTTDPAGLPGTQDVDKGDAQGTNGELADLFEELKAIKTEINEIFAAQPSEAEALEPTPTLEVFFEQLFGTNVETTLDKQREEHLRDLWKRGESVRDAIRDLGGNPDIPPANLDSSQPENFTPQFPSDLGDGEALLYAPRPASVAAQVSWPMTALGYDHRSRGVVPLSSTGERSIFLGGRPVKLWSRLNGTILDGSLGRSGAAGSLQAGLVVGVTPKVDLGIFGHILAGRATSASLGSLDSLAGGAGLYTKIKLGGGFAAGLSALHEWGRHNISLGGATGVYNSALWSVSANLSRPVRTGGGVVITPALSANWSRLVNGGYSDSNGLAVPQTMQETLTFSGTFDIARTFVLSRGPFTRATPRLTLSGNYHALRASALSLGSLGMLSSSQFTAGVGAGVALAMQDGGVFDFALQARGIGGNERAYSARAGLRVPLN